MDTKSGHCRWPINSSVSFRKMQQTGLTAKIFRVISLLSQQALLIASLYQDGPCDVTVLQRTKPEGLQEIPTIKGPLKLSEFIIYLYIIDEPESLVAHHLASIARDVFACSANNQP